MLLLLALASVILFCLPEISIDEVHMIEVFFPLEWVTAEVFVVCHSLEESKTDTVQYNVDDVIVSYLGIDIAYIDIVQVFLDSTSFLEITDFVESPVWLIVATIVFPNGILDFLKGSIPVPVSFPLFQCFTFHG